MRRSTRCERASRQTPMPANPGTLEALAAQVGQVLAPLASQLAPANVIPFLAGLGLEFPPELLSQGGFTGALTAGCRRPARSPA